MPRCCIGIPEGLAMAFHPQFRDVKGSGATRHRFPLSKATTTGLHDFLALRNSAGPSGSVLQISLLAHQCFFSPGMTGRLPLTTSQLTGYLKTLGNLAARNRQNLSATQVGRNNDEEAAPTSETKETAEGDTDTNKTTSTATSSLNNREGAHQKSTDMECDQKVVGKKPREITKEGRTPDEVCAEEAPPKTQILRWPSMKLKHKVPIDRRMAPPADLPEGVVLTADFATERY
ncbi:hypothetical protein MRX96_000511 [Rhipicephalus microplus]